VQIRVGAERRLAQHFLEEPDRPRECVTADVVATTEADTGHAQRGRGPPDRIHLPTTHPQHPLVQLQSGRSALFLPVTALQQMRRGEAHGRCRPAAGVTRLGERIDRV